jgi:hypothetical protein
MNAKSAAMATEKSGGGCSSVRRLRAQRPWHPPPLACSPANVIGPGCPGPIEGLGQSFFACGEDLVKLGFGKGSYRSRNAIR